MRRSGKLMTDDRLFGERDLEQENQELRKANKLLHAFLIERKLAIEYLKWKRMMLDE